jgi:hypothetical protein
VHQKHHTHYKNFDELQRVFKRIESYLINVGEFLTEEELADMKKMKGHVASAVDLIPNIYQKTKHTYRKELEK